MHLVTDKSNFTYIDAAQVFLDWCRKKGLNLEDDEDIDRALADRLKSLCHRENKNTQARRNLVAGLQHIFVDLRHELPRAHRAMRGWEKLAVTEEGMPVPIEAVLVVAEFLAPQGYFAEPIIILPTMDRVLREQDWEMPQEVVDDGFQTTLTSGDRLRGGEVKTGVQQGVVIKHWWVRELFLVLSSMKGCCRGPLVVPFPPSHLREVWSFAIVALAMLFLGPLHKLRHALPADDVEKKARTLEEIRRRGRWASLPSVQRYPKEYLRVRQRALMDQDLRARGEYLRDHPAVSVKAIMKNKGKQMWCCKRRTRVRRSS